MKSKSPPFIETYHALIATPLVGATEEALDQSNADLITPLVGRFKDLGLNVEVQPVPGTRNEFNMLANCGQGVGGLLLARHTDTVSFDDGRWTHDSLTPARHDDKPCDLGAADMKSFFVFILDALRDVNVMKLKRPLHILAIADEETNMVGARRFAKTIALRPNYAITGEPTLLQPVCAHRGHISNVIYTQGQLGHSNDPVRGINAIELMYNAIGYILQLCDSLKKRYHYEAFIMPHPMSSPGHIHGDDASNRICTYCELHMDIRPPPGMILSELNGLLNDALTPVSERWPGRLTVDKLHPSTPGYECPPNHQLVRVAGKLFGARTEVVNYCTEALFI